MQNDTNKFSIWWQPFSKDSEVAKEFKVPIDITLPFFIEGENYLRLERREGVALSEYSLLIGLLVEYFTPPPLTCVPEMRLYSKNILCDLLKRFQEQDPIEKFILVICAELREEYGEAVSRRALRTGLEIFPKILELISKPSQDY